MLSVSKLPSWVQMQSLLGEKFFNACLQHPEEKRNEMNLFCLDCCKAICTHCSPEHLSHHVLQIRKYMYNYVLRLEDARKLMNCSQVQTYISNTEKVVYLKQRTQSRPSRNSKCCNVCQKGIQQNFDYCSFFCKLEFMQQTGQLQWSEPGPVEMLRQEPVLEPAGSGSVEAEVVRRRRNGVDSCRPVVSTVETPGLMISSRRKKGTPFRAPLY